jgi:hypothetical protein
MGGKPISEAINVLYTTHYTQQFEPIINLRVYWSVSTFILGLILSFNYMIAHKYKSTSLFLNSVLLLLFTLSTYFPFGGRGIHGLGIRAVLLSQPVTALFIASFIEQPRTYFKRFKRLRKLRKHSQITLLATIFLFMIAMPLLMYSHMALVYPPNSFSTTYDFVTRHGNGHIIVIGGHDVYHYFKLVNNVDLKFDYGEHYEELSSMAEKHQYDIITTAFRVYVKDPFVKYEPSLTERMVKLEHALKQNYGLVYYADSQHKMYWNVAQ